MYSFASSRSPSGFVMKSAPVPSSPPASSKPGWPGGMKCVGMSPVIGPPNACRSAFLSITALSARRTSGLSNGGRSVLTAM